MNNKNISKKQAEKVLAERDPYVGIVLEDINNKLKTVLNGQAMSDSRIDRLHGSVSRLEVKVEQVDTRLSGVEITVDKIDHKLTKVEARLSGVENRLSGLTSEVKSGFEKVNNWQESHKIAMTALDNRVSNLEKSAA